MLGLGWSEMLVLAVVVLIVVGPKDLPVMLRNLGRMMGTVRRMSNDFRREIDKAVALDEVKEAKRSISDPLRQTTQDINREFHSIRQGKVEPSGKLKPSEPGKESVADEIRAQAGMTPGASDAGDREETAAAGKTKAAMPSARAKAAAREEAKSAAAAESAAPGKAGGTKATAKKSAGGASRAAANASSKPKAKSKTASANGRSKAGTSTTSARTPSKSKTPAGKGGAAKAQAGAAPKSGDN